MSHVAAQLYREESRLRPAMARRRSSAIRRDMRPDISLARQERQRFMDWLQTQGPPPWEVVQALWASIERDLPDLPLPVAGPGEEGRAQLAWSLADHYLEIEVSGDARIFWYARDLGAGSSESGEGGVPLPPQLRDWLERLSHA